MTDWPTASDYSRALVNPATSFRLPQLQACEVACNPATLRPIVYEGTLAHVYRAEAPDGEEFAIRVFSRASGKTRRDRYINAMEYLGSLDERWPSPLVKFQYVDKAIRVSSIADKWYPILLMEWVRGVTLFDWVQDTCRRGDVRQLASAAEKWIDLVCALRGAYIAHGDMSHTNVLVTSTGELKLVDYDNLCVPALVGQPNLEVGTHHFQHRERDGHTRLNPELDNFPALSILTALHAFSVKPTLWDQFNEGRTDGTLLFRHQDFESPDLSELYCELQQLDSTTRSLCDTLFAAWRGKMEDVPPLSNVIIGAIESEEIESEEIESEEIESEEIESEDIDSEDIDSDEAPTDEEILECTIDASNSVSADPISSRTTERVDVESATSEQSGIDVVISYARTDTESVRQLVSRLREAGVRVWADWDGIDGALQWSKEIVEAIEQCKAVILVASQSAFESHNVRKEVTLACEERKHIIPVFLESARPPPEFRYHLAGIQRIEYFEGNDDRNFTRILTSLERLGVTRNPQPSDNNEPP